MYLRPVDSRTCTFRMIGDGDGGRARASAWGWSQVLAMLTRGAAAPRKALCLRRPTQSVYFRGASVAAVALVWAGVWGLIPEVR